MMESHLEMAKEYLRIDGDHDNNLIGLLVKSAKAYLSNAGVKEPKDNNELYNLAVTMLVTHWYERREQSMDGKTSRVIELGLQTIILQLKAGGLSESS